MIHYALFSFEPTTILTIAASILGAIILGALSLRGIIYNCPPNEVLIFTGRKRRVGNRIVGYRIIKGGFGWRIPMLERVDRMDLTNMVIDVTAVNAYSKGGIPLSVQGVANVKVAGHEPLLNNAIERFLGKSRQEIIAIAKSTLEGSLRGILATMTPEQVNEDKILFAERLVLEVEQDMTALGLVVDTMKIQTVSDEVRYLDSIGRKRNAEIVSRARIAEAIAHADSVVRSSENLEQETKAQVDAQTAIAKAEAQRKLADIRSRKDALVAEELAEVNAAVARALAEVEVQKARMEQVRRQLDADVIQPALAEAKSKEAAAIAEVAAIIEEGRARAEALKKVAASLEQAGAHGKDLLLLQKLPQVIEAMSNVLAETHVERVTIIDSVDGEQASLPARAVSTLEQIKQLFGVDLAAKLREWGEPSGDSHPKPQRFEARPAEEKPPEQRPTESRAEPDDKARPQRPRKRIRIEPQSDSGGPSFVLGDE